MSRAKTKNLVNDERRGSLLVSSLMLALLTAVLFTMLSASGFAATTESAGKKVLSPADVERARNYFTDTLLTTHEGKQVRFYSELLDNRIVVINVMYTSCKGACPMITQTLSFISEQVGSRFGGDIHFISISNDPERDTPEVLTEFAQEQGVNLRGWTFLTGPKSDVDGVIKKIGLYESNFEQHKSMLLIGNTRTGHWQKIPPTMPPQAIVVKLKEAAGGGV